VAASGSVYVVTGNATSSPATFGYSDSVLQMSPDLHTVRSYFAPSNWAELNRADTDLGSVGAALLPGGLVVSIGKEGVAYVLRAGALGGVGGQLASRKVCAGAWGGTAWSGATVYVPCADGLVALNVSATAIDVAWSVAVPHLASPIVAAGAVWAIEPSTGTLYALDPAQGRNVLFKTSLGAANQFSTPAATELSSFKSISKLRFAWTNVYTAKSKRARPWSLGHARSSTLKWAAWAAIPWRAAFTTSASSTMFRCGAAACWRRGSAARTTLLSRRCQTFRFPGT